MIEKITKSLYIISFLIVEFIDVHKQIATPFEYHEGSDRMCYTLHGSR